MDLYFHFEQALLDPESFLYYGHHEHSHSTPVTLLPPQQNRCYAREQQPEQP
jgi:hypothetical protein